MLRKILTSGFLFVWLASAAQPARLNQRLEKYCTENPDATGVYFAWLYHYTTQEIDRCNKADSNSLCKNFRDTLVNTFGDAFFSGMHPDSKIYCWKVALDSQKGNARFVKSLILGANAHINHDLVFALRSSLAHFPTDSFEVLKLHYLSLFDNLTIASDTILRRLMFAAGLNAIERKITEQAFYRIARNVKNWRNEAWEIATTQENSDQKLHSHLKKAEKIATDISLEKGVIGRNLKKFNRLDLLTRYQQIHLLN